LRSATTGSTRAAVASVVLPVGTLLVTGGMTRSAVELT
jgi:hypothetical protein